MTIQIVLQALAVLAPVPTAWGVYDDVSRVFGWPTIVSAVAAITVEATGWLSIYMTLHLYSYNRTRRKLDPAAPIHLALATVVIYLVVVIALVVMLDLPNAKLLRPYIKGVFVLLSLDGGLLTALDVDHRERLLGIAERDEKRRRARAPIGKVVTDNGRVVTDSVKAVTDSGKVVTDGGRAVTDSGKAVTDSGKVVTDSGEVVTDNVTDSVKVVTDNGETVTDNGEAVTDNGKAVTDGVTDNGGVVTDNGGIKDAVIRLVEQNPSLTAKQIASMLGVSTRTVYRYRKLAAVRDGR